MAYVKLTLAQWDAEGPAPDNANPVVVFSVEEFLSRTNTKFEDWKWDHGDVDLEFAMTLPNIAEAIRSGKLRVFEQ